LAVVLTLVAQAPLGAGARKAEAHLVPAFVVGADPGANITGEIHVRRLRCAGTRDSRRGGRVRKNASAMASHSMSPPLDRRSLLGVKKLVAFRDGMARTKHRNWREQRHCPARALDGLGRRCKAFRSSCPFRSYKKIVVLLHWNCNSGHLRGPNAATMRRPYRHRMIKPLRPRIECGT